MDEALAGRCDAVSVTRASEFDLMSELVLTRLNAALGRDAVRGGSAGAFTATRSQVVATSLPTPFVATDALHERGMPSASTFSPSTLARGICGAGLGVAVL